MAEGSGLGEELNLGDYWGIIRKRIVAVLVVFAAVFASTVVYTKLKHPLFRAQTLIKFELPVSVMSGQGAMLAFAAGVQTQVNLLSSLDMAQRVAERTKADIGKIRGSYKVERLGQTALMTVTVTGTEPAAAATLANVIVDTYIEWDLEVRSRQTRKNLEELEARAKDAKDDLLRLEDRQREFLENHQTTGLGSVLAGNLLDLESRRKEMLRKFTEAHPDVRKLDERIALTRERLEALPGEQEELERLVRDLRVREATYIALSRQIEESRIALQSTISYVSVLSRAEAPGRPFSPNRPLNYAAGAVMGAFLGFMVALIIENLDISITTIEEIEKVVGAPVLGVIPHFGSESRWHDFMGTYLNKSRHPDSGFRSFLVFRQPPKSPVIEVYHALRVNIQAQLAKPQSLVVTFTSTGVAEGKTLTAVNFAMASAHSGLKTLLIGADIRRPSLHRIFGLPKEPGLIEAVTGRVPWRDTIRGTVDYLMGEQDLERLSAFPGIDNLKMMTGWTASTAEVVNIFSSERLPRLIADLRTEFDIVIFDCPPVLLFVDAVLIGQHTDGVVLIYKSGKMARRALKRAKDQVVLSHGKILGIALNDARAASMEPGYGSYSDYGHYAKPQPPNES
ncbi:MAG: polysaccharide biosynthesis tyrosine autokinase [Elusimicrobia bacterium]|nr:polysaccharide biosynthesis tyrosine autokinase [Elusimicrobiota bacterium]